MNLIDESRILSDARAAREAGADVVVVSVHWGTEWQTAPDARQLRLGRALAASATDGRPDVDLVLGTHAHVPQAYEKVGDTWIVYGMGDQIAGRMVNHPAPYDPRGNEGTISRFTFTPPSSPGGRWQVTRAEFLPQWFDTAANRVVDLNAAIASGDTSLIPVHDRITTTALSRGEMPPRASPWAAEPRPRRRAVREALRRGRGPRCGEVRGGRGSRHGRPCCALRRVAAAPPIGCIRPGHRCRTSPARLRPCGASVMKKDQMPSGRRVVLRIAAALGATTAVGLFGSDRASAPGGTAAARPSPPGRKASSPPSGRPAAPAGGPQAGGPVAPAAAARPRLASTPYRLQPMTSNAPPRLRRALPRCGSGRSCASPARATRWCSPSTTGLTPATLRCCAPCAGTGCGPCSSSAARWLPSTLDLVRRMAAEGHVVGNHSWSHPLIPKLPPSRIREELSATSEVVEQATGSPPLWYRAPYGAWNRHSFEIGAELGMEPLA